MERMLTVVQTLRLQKRPVLDYLDPAIVARRSGLPAPHSYLVPKLGTERLRNFHFQNWFKARLEEIGMNFEIGGRNSYHDFRMVASTEGYELKGLAWADENQA